MKKDYGSKKKKRYQQYLERQSKKHGTYYSDIEQFKNRGTKNDREGMLSVFNSILSQSEKEYEDLKESFERKEHNYVEVNKIDSYWTKYDGQEKKFYIISSCMMVL